MFIHMLSIEPQIMSLTIKTRTEVTFRKKSEPCRIVSFSSLNKTQINRKEEVHKSLVSSDGNISSDSWKPISYNTKTIEISTTGWDGLVSRYFDSKLEFAEVA
jgi:hypothetical protein|tara:strand:- start:1059 stop:1367 length:309 start_codon:yes stop_codon:yes gene_type:complete